jgi:ZIP family zinc transporter
MLQPLLFGVIASSALVLGGVLGSYWQAPIRITGVMLAFASGSLIAALAFELFPEAVAFGGLVRSGAGLLIGAAVFVLVNTALDRYSAPQSGGEQADQREVVQESSRGIGLALLAAVTLDGLPENLALGVSLTEAGSLTLLVAIFASNFPEALVGSIAMRRDGRRRRFTIGIWTLTAIVLTITVIVGWLLGEIAESILSFMLAFAGGAVLASLADTLMPEAFEHGKPLNSFATAAGFFISFVLAGSGS